MSRVAIFSHVNMPKCGQGIVVHSIRAMEMANALRAYGHKVALYQPINDKAKISYWNKDEFRDTFKRALIEEDVVVVSLNLAHLIHWMRINHRRAAVVVDCFDPLLVNVIPSLPKDIFGEIGFERFRLQIETMFKIGDFFLCASAEQRLWILGLLSAWGRLSPLTYDDEMIAIVPTGAPLESPRNKAGFFRGRIVPENSEIILWPGGVFAWYRPGPLLDAMPRILMQRPNARLIFVGASNAAFEPQNPILSDLQIKAENLNKGNGKKIFFLQSLPYSERDLMYCDADIAVCLFEHTLENELSFRTRLVDIIWGGIPLVTSGGNSLCKFLEEYGCAVTINNLDDSRIAEAICGILNHNERKNNMSSLARKCASEHLNWKKSIEALNIFCESPKSALDQKALAVRGYFSTFRQAIRLFEDTSLRFKRKKAYIRTFKG